MTLKQKRRVSSLLKRLEYSLRNTQQGRSWQQQGQALCVCVCVWGLTASPAWFYTRWPWCWDNQLFSPVEDFYSTDGDINVNWMWAECEPEEKIDTLPPSQSLWSLCWVFSSWAWVLRRTETSCWPSRCWLRSRFPADGAEKRPEGASALRQQLGVFIHVVITTLFMWSSDRLAC